jgi:predicted MFS family arabinose efflux permease
MSTADSSDEPEPDSTGPLPARPANSNHDATAPKLYLVEPPAEPQAASASLTASQSESPLFTRPFVRLLGMQAAYGFSFSMFFLLPKYLAAAGESPSRIGLVMGGFGVACLCTIPFLQIIVARLGRRGALMAATLSLAVAGAVFALVLPVGVAAIFLRASEGVTWTIVFSTAGALTAEMAPRGRLAQAIGLAGAAALTMNAVAPSIGEPLAEAFGYRPVFLLAALAALGAAAMARRLPELRTPTSRAPSTSNPLEQVARIPAANTVEAKWHRLPIYVVFGLSGVAFSTLFTFLAPFALGHGVHQIRAFFIGYTGAAIMVRLLGGRLADRLGHRTIAAVSLALYGTVVASTALFGPHHLYALGICFGLAHGAVFPAMMALLINSTPPHQRPRVLGLANGAMSIGISTVFPAGALIARIGYPAMFAISGGLVALSAVLIRRGRD